jgi:hypothetical protein
MDIIDFLRARLKEQDCGEDSCTCWTKLDIAAKRAIVDVYEATVRADEAEEDVHAGWETRARREALYLAVFCIARIDRGHPDFDGTWQPEGAYWHPDLVRKDVEP